MDNEDAEEDTMDTGMCYDFSHILCTANGRLDPPVSLTDSTGRIPTVHAVGYGPGVDLQDDDATDVLLKDTYPFLPSLK